MGGLVGCVGGGAVLVLVKAFLFCFFSVFFCDGWGGFRVDKNGVFFFFLCVCVCVCVFFVVFVGFLEIFSVSDLGDHLKACKSSDVLLYQPQLVGEIRNCRTLKAC